MLNAINILNKLFFLKKVFAFLLILIAILSLNETSSKEDALSENQTIYYANFLKPKNCRINTVFGSFLCKKIKKTIPLKNKTWRHDKSLPSFQKYVIASQGEATTKAGARMFNLGGNIVDAAIAISFAISVERPQSTGIGGGGFMLIHWAKQGKTLALDFRETSPLKSHPKMYLDQKDREIKNLSRFGPLSVAVPGLVAGLLEVHKQYGTLPLSTVLEPAIELAKNGFPVYPHLHRAIKYSRKTLKKFEGSKKIFLKQNGKPLNVDDILIQEDLSWTLEQIAEHGKDGFYKGPVAEKIIETNKKYGGLISQADLDAYTPKWREPISGTFNEYSIFSMSPPSSGGIHVVQILNILEALETLNPEKMFSPQNINLTTQAMQKAFADRASYLGDSDFVNVPVQGLTSKSYASEIAKSISKQKVTPSKEVFSGNPLPFESPETTHFSIIDSEGNAISSTQTINYWLGSGVVVEGTGIVLNNEMDDFSTKPGASNIFGAVGSDKNLPEPLKRPLSSMSPTLVLNNQNQVVMSLGTPSGTRIITCVVSTIINHYYYQLSLSDSIKVIRYHHQWQPDLIQVDKPGFPDHLIRGLKNMGHKIRVKDLGCKLNAVTKTGAILQGMSDPRGEGLVLGK